MKTWSILSLSNKRRFLIVTILLSVTSRLLAVQPDLTLTPLEASILAHEGKSSYAYRDTMGYLTIGIGKNIDRRSRVGLEYDEMLLLLRDDIEDCKDQLNAYDFYSSQNAVRKDVLIELCYNMGIPVLLKFKKMIKALSVKDYSEASYQLLDSKWAAQVGRRRSSVLAERILSGTYVV